MHPSISSGLNSVVLWTITRLGERPACLRQVEIHRPGHDAEHFGAGKVGVIASNFDFVGVVGDKLEAGAFGVEDLTAAGDKARPF